MVEEPPHESPTRAFLVRLLVEEESLYGLLLVERVVVPAVLLAWMVFTGSSLPTLVSASLFVAWALTTSLAMRSRLALLKRRPALLLSIEQAACIAVFLGVGSWRGTFYYTLASPTVFAAIFVGTELALAFAVVASVVVVVSVGAFRMQDGRGPRDTTSVEDWGGAPPLFVAAALIISLIRRLLDRVARLGQHADAVQADLSRMRQEAANENARRALTSDFHGDIRQALTSLPARWRTIASMPAFAGSALALRQGASLAEKGGADVKALVVHYRPLSPAPLAAIPVTEGAEVLAEVDEQERRYFKAIVIARLLFAAYIALFLVDASGARSRTIFFMWVAMFVWVLVTSAKWMQLYARLKARRSLLVVEEAVGVALLLFGTTQNGNIFWLMGATAAVLATAVGTIVQAASYAVASALAAYVSIYIAQHMGWQSWSPSASGTFAATIGYLAPVLPALYVRFLLDRLRRDGRKLQERSEEAEGLRLDLALDQARREATPRLVEQVRPIVDGLKDVLSRVDSERDAIITEKARVIALEEALERLEGHARDGVFAGRDPVLDEVVEVALSRLRDLGGEASLATGPLRLLIPTRRAEALSELLTEALVNAFRHGGPPIEVHGQAHGQRALIVVADHGLGFDVDRELARSGLWALRRCEQLAQAQVLLTSDSSGTQVRIEFSV